MEKAQRELFIEKSETNVIKGIALIFMFVHHFFGFPSWYMEAISYPELEGWIGLFGSGLKSCVGIFAFLTGYFYYYNSDKSYCYAFRKSTDLWVSYFVTFVVLLIPAILMNCYDISISKLLAEAAGLYYSVMIFAWYVPFYIITMFVLPFLSKMGEKSMFFSIILAVILPIVLVSCFGDGPTTLVGGIVYDLLGNAKWLLCVMSGYVIARFSLFSSMDEKIADRNLFVRIAVYIAFMILALICRIREQAYDWIYAPMIVYSVAGLCKLISNKKFLIPISVIGKYSLPMWFVHGMFFNVCREKLQWLLYLPKHPVLVLIWGLLLCMVPSVLIMMPVNWLNKMKNRILSRIFSEGKGKGHANG